MTDHTNDLLIRIKNAYLSRHKQIVLPYFKLGENIAKLLQANNYLAKVEVVEDKTSKAKKLQLELLYKNRKPSLTGVKIISKPGVRVYGKAKKLGYTISGIGITIVTTPLGVITGKEASKKSVGGEVIAEVW
jgi:small subunit ribosomal protein S8